MQPTGMRNSVARFCEWTAIVLATLAMTSGFVLGSGESAAAHSVFVALAAAALASSFVSMLVEGKFRIVRSPLWFCALAILAIGFLQILPNGTAALPDGLFQATEPDVVPRAASISIDRAATLESLVWLTSALVIVFVLSSHVRTASRLCAVTAAMSVVLGLSGFVGFLQTLSGRQDTLGGLLSLNDSRTPAVVQQIFAPVGNSSVWAAVGGPTDGVFFLPESTRQRYFGGMLSPEHFAACVIVGLPLLLAMVVYLSGFAGTGGWRTHGESKIGHLLWALGLCLAGTAAWFGDRVLVAGLIFVLLAVTSILVGRGERRRSLPRFLLASAVLSVVAGTAIAVSGLPNLGDRYHAWLADVMALTSMIRDYPWLGSGLGTGPEMTSLYLAPTDTALRASSLTVLLGEIGLVGGAILASGFLYTVARLLWKYTSLERDGKVALAGAATGLLGLAVVAVYSRSIVPAVMASALLPSAVLLRALAGGFRDEEALFPQ